MFSEDNGFNIEILPLRLTGVKNLLSKNSASVAFILMQFTIYTDFD